MGQVSARYTWGGDSPVSKVEFAVSADGSKKSAAIYAGDHVERGGLAKIPSALTRYGFSKIYAEVLDGKNALIIDGVGDEGKVLAALGNLGILKGEPERETFPVHVVKGKMGDWLKKNALNVNGVFGTIGHAAMAGTGVLQNDKDRMWNGILGGMVPLMLGVCGNGKKDLDFDPVFENMRKYFAAEGLQLPTFTEEHKKSLLGIAQDFISSHPVPIAYSIGMAAGYKGLKSAWNQMSKGQGGYERFAAVASSQIGNLVVLGIPEKEKNILDHEEAKDQTLTQEIANHFKAFAKDPIGAIQAAPMFWDGALKFMDNILYGMDTYKEIKKVNKIWAHNREESTAPPGQKSYHQLADDIRARLKELGAREDVLRLSNEGLANIVVRKGRPSTQFGQLIKGLEGDDKILQTLRGTQGFSPNPVLDTIESIGAAAEKKSALLGDLENFARKEEEYRIATSQLGKKSPWLAGVTAATFTIATAMEALASKNRDKSYMNDDAYNKLFALAARSVNDIAPEDRAFMIRKMASYLAGQSEIHNAGITSERVEQEITKRIDAIENSPWMAHISSHAQQAVRVPASAEEAARAQTASVH